MSAGAMWWTFQPAEDQEGIRRMSAEPAGKCDDWCRMAKGEFPVELHAADDDGWPGIAVPKRTRQPQLRDWRDGVVDRGCRQFRRRGERASIIRPIDLRYVSDDPGPGRRYASSIPCPASSTMTASVPMSSDLLGSSPSRVAMAATALSTSVRSGFPNALLSRRVLPLRRRWHLPAGDQLGSRG